MFKHSSKLIWCFAIALLWGCGGGEIEDVSQPNQTNTTTKVDMSTKEDMAVEGDAGAEDMSVAQDLGCVPKTVCEAFECGVVLDGCGGVLDCNKACEVCQDTSQCGEGTHCIDGTCRPVVVCGKDGVTNKRAMSNCRETFAVLGYGDKLVAQGMCRDEVCQVPCLSDQECAPGNVCVEDGVCAPMSITIPTEVPGGGARAPLKAGVGNVLMKFPIGLPLGGYGSRASGDKGRYNEGLSESRGQFHGLYARTVLLDNGEKQVALVRMPIIFPTGTIFEAVAQKLQDKDGKNWRQSLVISATHTHSGPGRLFHLPKPENVIVSFAFVGTDELHQQAFDWVVDSAVESIEAAQKDLSEAKLGWGIVESYDQDDAIASDRWGETPPFDDNRVLMIRIDDTNDVPRAALLSFGTHGIFNDTDFATGDSAGGVERAFEAKLGESFGRHVPTMFISENGGSMSPRGGKKGHRSQHKTSYIGYEFTNRVWEQFTKIQTKSDIALNSASLRFPLGYDTLGYEPGEWVDVRTGEELRAGGFLCNIGETDSDWDTYSKKGDVKCAGIARLNLNRAPVFFLRSQMSALQIDDLTMVTIPGEATMELGWQILRDFTKAHNLDPFKAWTIGYAQDHKFYLPPTDLRGELPPFPGISTPKAPDEYGPFTFSYYQSGYEAEFNIWGPRMGDFLVARSVEVVGLLLGKPMQPEFPQPAPQIYAPRDDQPFAKDATDPSLVGKAVLQPPEFVERLSMVSFEWVGGDPGAEMPQAPLVVLQKKDMAGAWETLQAPNLRPYDNRERLMISRVRSPEEGSTQWEWIVMWEELKDFPLGTYRFQVQGHYFNEAFERTPYTLESNPFEVVPTSNMSVGLTASGNTVTATVGYAPAEELKINTSPREHVPMGSFRLRNPDVPTGVSDPAIADQDLDATGVSVKLGGVQTDSSGISVATTSKMVDGRLVPVTEVTIVLPQGSQGSVEVEIRDKHGNSGSSSIDL